MTCGARNLLYYVSGHGYGHATRSAAIIEAFVAERPAWNVLVRTSAPEHLFAGLARTSVYRLEQSLDPGVVEDADALGVDAAATLEQLESCYRRRQSLVAAEVAWLKTHRISLLVADFPPAAGEIAAAAGVPAIGVGNFTWDWLYEPLFSGHEHWDRWQAWLRSGYGKMQLLLRLPFSHATGLEMFPAVQTAPLAMRRSTREPGEVLAALGLDSADRRRRVVLAMRGRIPLAARRRAALECGDLVFLHFDADAADLPENMRAVALGPRLKFPDVLQAADAVVSKLGYGILSECIAAEKPIMHPPRQRFREDEIFAVEAGRFARLAPISQADFAAGCWRESLACLWELPRPAEKLPLDGAAVCARAIGDWADQT